MYHFTSKFPKIKTALRLPVTSLCYIVAVAVLKPASFISSHQWSSVYKICNSSASFFEPHLDPTRVKQIIPLTHCLTCACKVVTLYGVITRGDAFLLSTLISSRSNLVNLKKHYFFFHGFFSASTYTADITAAVACSTPRPCIERSDSNLLVIVGDPGQ